MNTNALPLDRGHFLLVLSATGWNVAKAAAQLGLHPNTLAYQLRRHGIKRPAAPSAPVECHPPLAPLLGCLEELRARARAVVRMYLPGPARAAMLRENEREQLALLVRLRPLLGDRPMFGGVRSSQAPGALRPGWGLRF